MVWLFRIDGAVTVIHEFTKRFFSVYDNSQNIKLFQ